MAKIGTTIWVLAVWAALTLPSAALQNPAQPSGGESAKQLRADSPGRKPGSGKRGHKGFRRPGKHGGDWLRKMHNLPPEEQERALQNDPEFQRLSPEKQARLRKRLRKFNALPQEERQRILQRWERFEHYTPEQQERLRGFHDRMREMPPDRRRMMYRALRHLREMPSGERERVLGSERFRNNFSDEERNLLRGMAEVGPPTDAKPDDRLNTPRQGAPPPE